MLKDVDASALTGLLDLQGEDSAIARLSHRRATLPEAQHLAEISESLDELDADVGIALKQRDELAREQTRIEGEGALLDDKIAREEGRLFAGVVANPRELTALQSEIEMLKRRKASREDELLEVMVNRDNAEEILGRLQRERDEMAVQADELRRTVEGLRADIDAELAHHTAARERAAGRLPEDLVALYEKVRASKGGVGVAKLEGGTCTGCHTRLPAKEAERLRSGGGLHRCDNCRRLLVVV